MTPPKGCGAAYISLPMFRPMMWTWCLYTSSQFVTAGHAVDDDPTGDRLGRGQAGVDRGPTRRLQQAVTLQVINAGTRSHGWSARDASRFLSFARTRRWACR